MSRFYILDDDHKVVPVSDVVEWAKWVESKGGNRHVALTDVKDVRVSTVFLGVDHNHFGDGPPILFETMIFGGEHDQHQERYATWDGALAGHGRAVEMIS